MRASPDLIEAGVASDANAVGSNSLLAQALGVALIDGAGPLDRAIGVAEQRAGESAAAPG
jgi:hypothetical protein